MKKLTLTVIVICTLTAGYTLKAEESVIKGLYQGIDLYVLNPMLDDEGSTYCVTEIFINNTAYNEVLNSSAFCIALSKLNFEVGESIEIKFLHSSNCAPKVINPEVLKSITTFSVVSMSMNSGMFNFVTQGETSKIPFRVEQFKWNRWVKVAEVEGMGGPDENSYSVKVIPVSGENKFRITQQDHLYRTRMSDEFLYIQSGEAIAVKSKLKKVKSEILLSGISMYEIVNSYGAVVLHGIGEVIDVSGLPKGKYILAYENTFVNFSKK